MTTKLMRKDDLESLFEIRGKIAKALRTAMKRKKITQTQLALRMGSARAVVHRLLSDTGEGVLLSTICRACVALDLKLKINIVGPRA